MRTNLSPRRLAILFLVSLAATASAAPDDYFKIKVVDEQTGRGVPLVELRTVNNARYYTDSAGVAAFHEPGLMNQSVFFHVRSHGYEFPKDGFGIRGKALATTPGAKAVLKIRRTNMAQRLYRVTGGGVYRDSALLGEPTPLEHPILNARVFGSDSAVNAVYRGELFWFWGDTNRPKYPLGNFHVPGAVSRLPDKGGLDPEQGVDLQYFTDEQGFAKETARMPGSGPTWIDGLTVLRNEQGRERMFARYVKVRGFLEIYQRGIVQFNDEQNRFIKVTEFDNEAPLQPAGHPLFYTAGGVDYVYFATPFPLVRVKATPDDFCDVSQYEAFTCWKEGGGERRELDRNADGRLRYAWRKGLPAVGPREQQRLIRENRIQRDEALLQVRDIESGEPVQLHSGSVYFNDYRQRFVMIAVQSGGSSALGEVWFAEADTPLGPWVYARKIITHDHYSFYNPKQHPMFDADGGKSIFLEGTYTTTFSGRDNPTPWYDYNQIMYKLDLSDARLALPVPVYSSGGEASRFSSGRELAGGQTELRVAFYAPDRPFVGSIAVYQADGRLKLCEPADVPEGAKPLFFALPVDDEQQSPGQTPLYEFERLADGKKAYSIDPDWRRDAYRRIAQPPCRVWRGPNLHLPRD